MKVAVALLCLIAVVSATRVVTHLKPIVTLRHAVKVHRVPTVHYVKVAARRGKVVASRVVAVHGSRLVKKVVTVPVRGYAVHRSVIGGHLGGYGAGYGLGLGLGLKG